MQTQDAADAELYETMLFSLGVVSGYLSHDDWLEAVAARIADNTTVVAHFRVAHARLGDILKLVDGADDGRA